MVRRPTSTADAALDKKDADPPPTRTSTITTCSAILDLLRLTPAPPPPSPLQAPIIKSGKVVVLLQGRYAGRKAVVVKTYDDGSADRKFPHAVGE